METSRIKRDLESSEFAYRVYLVLYFILVIILMYAMLSFSVRHTYQLPISSPGTLVSDRWDFNFVREWLFWLYGLVLLSGPFMRLSRGRGGVGVHLALLILLLFWSVVNVIFDIIQLNVANLPPTADDFQASTLARDPRWCCVYGGQPGAVLICANNATLAMCPATGIATLTANHVFVTRVAINFLFIAFILYDIIVTWTAYLPLLNRYLNMGKTQ